GFVTDGAVGADHRAERRSSVHRHQAGDIANPADVGIAVFLAETQALGKVRADLVSVKQRAISAKLGQALDEGMSDGALSRARKSGEPDGHSLAEPGRIGLAQDFGHGWPAEPLGELESACQVLVANFSAGDIRSLGARGNFIDWAIAVFLGKK